MMNDVMKTDADRSRDSRRRTATVLLILGGLFSFSAAQMLREPGQPIAYKIGALAPGLLCWGIGLFLWWKSRKA